MEFIVLPLSATALLLFSSFRLTELRQVVLRFAYRWKFSPYFRSSAFRISNLAVLFQEDSGSVWNVLDGAHVCVRRGVVALVAK